MFIPSFGILVEKISQTFKTDPKVWEIALRRIWSEFQLSGRKKKQFMGEVQKESIVKFDGREAQLKRLFVMWGVCLHSG